MSNTVHKEISNISESQTKTPVSINFLSFSKNLSSHQVWAALFTTANWMLNCRTSHLCPVRKAFRRFFRIGPGIAINILPPSNSYSYKHISLWTYPQLCISRFFTMEISLNYDRKNTVLGCGFSVFLRWKNIVKIRCNALPCWISSKLSLFVVDLPDCIGFFFGAISHCNCL